nr:unnamed protein product [Callosobruchus analis]
MTTRKNPHLVTMELELEAYKVKNRSLSEHLAKVQLEKAQAYQDLNTLRQQYWKIRTKYCCLKNLVQDNMKENINMLINYQEKYRKAFTEGNDTSTETSMRSNESQNQPTNLNANRSQRSGLNCSDGSWDSLTEGISTRVVTTRKKYNSDKENSAKETTLTNGNTSSAHNSADSSQMAEVEVNIRKRRAPTEDDEHSCGGSNEDLWHVDVRLRASGSNANKSLDPSDDDEEEAEGEEKLDTIQVSGSDGDLAINF